MQALRPHGSPALLAAVSGLRSLPPPLYLVYRASLLPVRRVPLHTAAQHCRGQPPGADAAHHRQPLALRHKGRLHQHWHLHRHLLWWASLRSRSLEWCALSLLVAHPDSDPHTAVTGVMLLPPWRTARTQLHEKAGAVLRLLADGFAALSEAGTSKGGEEHRLQCPDAATLHAPGPTKGIKLALPLQCPRSAFCSDPFGLFPSCIPPLPPPSHKAVSRSLL